MECYLIVAAISLFKPPLIEILKYYWVNKIKAQEVRKSMNMLISIFLGIFISVVVNWIGEYELSKMQIFLHGTGISYTIGQITHRAVNIIQPLKKRLTVKGINGNK